MKKETNNEGERKMKRVWRTTRKEKGQRGEVGRNVKGKN